MEHLEWIGPHHSWNKLKFWDTYYKEVQPKLQEAENLGRIVLPAAGNRFKALELGVDDTKVIILGQEPYATKGTNDGLAFSTQPHVTPLPHSLRIIFEALEEDVGGIRPRSGSLTGWHSRGIQLLNTTLTVEENKPGSHTKLWKGFAYEALRTLSESKQPIVWMLWGKQAQEYSALVPSHHLGICTEYPSPLSSKLFRKPKQFSIAAEFLKMKPEELWRLDG